MTKVNIFKQCLEILALERFIPWLVGGRNMFLHKLLFLVIISGTNVNAVVIPNFTTNGISYYFYVFNEVTRLNYPEARTFCDNLGGSIAKVDSFDFGYEIQYQLQTFENDSDSHTWETPLDKGYWVSGYCTGGVGEWWFEDGERIVDTMWNEGEPDPATNTSHLFIISISPASGLWGSEDMSKFKNVICQISPPDGNSTGTEPTTTPLTSSSTPIYDSPKLEAELLFNGSLFMFYTGSYHGGWKFNFNQSQAWCVELGGSLALIKNNLTQHMITEQLFAMLPYVQPHGGGGDYWVGGEGVENDQQQEWVWLDGDNIDDGFTNWFSGYGSYEADYAVYDLGLAVVATDEDGLGKWDGFQKFVEQNFICQIDLCEPNPCENNGHCYPTVEGVDCQCLDGYNGTYCEQDLCDPNPCKHDGVCVGVGGSFQCDCSDGYEGPLCSERMDCVQGGCGANARCYQTMCVCLDGYYGDPYIDCVDYCATSSISNFTFPVVGVGSLSNSLEVCPQGFSRASAFCEVGEDHPLFVIDTIVDCDVTIDSIYDQLNTSNVTMAEVEEATSEIQLVTSTQRMDGGEMVQATETLNEIRRQVEGVEISTNLMTNYALTTSHVTMSLNNSTPVPTNQQNIQHDLLVGLVDMAKKVNVENSTNNQFNINTETSQIQVLGQAEQANASDIIFTPTDDTWDQTWRRSGNAWDQTWRNSSIEITIPREAVKQAWKNLNDTFLKTIFVFHKNDVLFPSTCKTQSVISADFNVDSKVSNLDDKVGVKFGHETSVHGKHNHGLMATLVEQRCVFWDFATSDWSSEGCGLDVTKQPPTCECSHLTNFALLVAIHEVPGDVALSVFADVGCAISIVGFALTILLHLINKKARQRTGIQIQLHVCFNLMVAYLLFMIGVPSVGNKTTCTIVAVLLHYTFLTSWFWMGIYSNRLYNSLVKIFSKPANHYMVKSSCLAYGLPLIIVGINLAVTVGYLDKKISRPLCPNDTPPPPSSLYIADNMCWIHQETLYFGFLLIVGLILLMNCIIFTILVYKLIIKRNEVQSSAKKRSKQQNLVMAITMCLSMGLTWVFGFLMLLSYDPGYQSVMSWLFTISIALQGLLVFYLTCVRNIEMFNFWWKPIKSIVTRQKYSPSKTALSSQSSRYTESQTI